MKETVKHIAIIGAGPSGLMAAEKLAEKGHVVTVYDAMASVGRKFLLAGTHGGLNLTHSEPMEAFIKRYGEASNALSPALLGFSSADLCAWCDGLGQKTFVGSSGRVFPKDKQAKTLLRAWLARLRTLGVSFVLKHCWQGWADDGALLFTDGAGAEVRVEKPDATLLALGGASWPRTGSDGNWMEILKREGVPLSPLAPSNCGFEVPWTPYVSRRFAGEPLKPVIVSFEKINMQGEITITKKGVEGSVIYALSPLLRKAIEREGKAILHIDLRPGLSFEDLNKKLHMPRKAQSFSTYLKRSAGLTPLMIALLREVVPPEKLPINDIEALTRLIKELPLPLTSTAPLARAISTAGGVKFDALDEHFMLRAKPGVFVAGEMMDWEAPTGGYLLQGCFSTAVRASEGMAAFLEK